MTERRRSSRIPIDQPVELTVAADGLEAVGYNLSLEGIAVKSPQPLAAGTVLWIRTQLASPDGTNTLETRGRVVHCSRIQADGRYRLGLEFEPLGRRNAGLLRKFLAAHRQTTPNPTQRR